MMSSDFFFNDTATTEIYTLSLHDALPISPRIIRGSDRGTGMQLGRLTEQSGFVRSLPRQVDIVPSEVSVGRRLQIEDRKSTRLNSSHANISYAVFCLKKKQHTCHTLIPTV